MELEPGRVIAGRYRLERRIGSGGMGEVWAAEHVSIGVRVALKTLLPSAAVDLEVVARFRREAYLLGRLRSDRVARVVDFMEDRALGLVLVMDFIEGESLASVLEQRSLRVEEAIDLGVDIATALADLHRAKVVHRDLKPDNIILEPGAGGRRRAVIVDFGVSRLDSGRISEDEEAITNITQADVALGTLPYMAPEQFLSSRDVTGAADLYAVGAILYRAVAGQHVYGDDRDIEYAKRKLTARAPGLPQRRVDRVARGLAAVVARALERAPEDRFESADALLAELTALQELARASAIDLDATTEQALPPSTIAEDGSTQRARPRIVDENTDGEATRLMSRPPAALEDAATETSPSAPPRISTPTTSSGRSTRPTSVPSTTPSPMRITVPSVGIEPPPRIDPPVLEPAPAAPVAITVPAPSGPRDRVFTRRELLLAIAVSLSVGVFLGVALARALIR